MMSASATDASAIRQGRAGGWALPWRLAARVVVLMLASLLPGVALAGEAVDVRAVQVRAVEDAAGSGAEVVVETSRAVSFDAGVQAAPLRLEMLVPGARLAKNWRVPRAGGLIEQVQVRPVSGGVLLSFGLRDAALIVDAHAERAAGSRPARLVVRLARTDTKTLAKMLGVEEAALQRAVAPQQRRQQKRQERIAQSLERSPGAVERIKAAYRKLIEQAAAQPVAQPAGIGDLIKALPMGYDESNAARRKAPGQKAVASQASKPSKPREQAKPAAPPAGAAKGGAKPVIVVDAGHGGRDPGAIGARGVKEKVIVLAFAKALRDALQRRGYRVVMTREGDTYLKLRERVAVARRHHAAMFISIHADKFRSRRAAGLGIFTLSEEASDEDAAALARMENAADLIGAPEDELEDDAVRDILVELTQRETNANSHLLAQRLARDLRKVARVRRNPVRSAAFRVLRVPEIPSLLVELGFITNPHDVRNMRSPAWRRKVAARMAQTIDQVLKTRLALR